MKRNQGMWLTFVLGLALAMGLAGCADPSPLPTDGPYAEAVPRGEEVEILGPEEIDATAGAYLQAMANLMLGETSSEKATALERAETAIPDSEFQRDLRMRIVAWRDQLAEMGLTYKSARSRVCADVQILGDDGRLYLCAREETGLLANGDEVEEGDILGVDFPPQVELTVVQTDPGIPGATATGGTKPAVTDTGATVKVPIFINEGDVIRVNTETNEYIERV